LHEFILKRVKAEYELSSLKLIDYTRNQVKYIQQYRAIGKTCNQKLSAAAPGICIRGSKIDGVRGMKWGSRVEAPIGGLEEEVPRI